MVLGVFFDLTFLGPDRLTTSWETPHLLVYRHYWDLVVAGVAWFHLVTASVGISVNFSRQIGDELPAFFFWAPFAIFFSFALFFVFLLSAMQEKKGGGRNALRRAFGREQGESQLRHMFPPLRASKRLSALSPVGIENTVLSVIPSGDLSPPLSPAPVVPPPTSLQGSRSLPGFDHFERVLLKSEASLESLRMGLESARRAGVNLVIDPSIAQANADLQELRSSLDEIDLAVEELRGHQHLLMATWGSQGDAKRVV
jgi:hypothetical protein